ncbi:MAG: TonB-dependent receptor [Acidobacteria bacterium]|nr:TonB-dependent receptor [Acidobacteriota bacterium]
MAPAQITTAEILGTVRDASGAVVANAQVQVHNLDTNNKRELTASNEGAFRATQLPPGNYEVIVIAKGFGKYVQGPIVLRLGQDAELTIRLEVANVTETVSVVSDAPLLNTTNSEVGTNFDVKRIGELPMAPNRNILNLALQIPGVSQLSSGNSSFAAGGVSFSVNGMRTRSNNFMLDGADSNNASVSGLVQEVNNPDLVAEFRVVTNQFAPEYGRAAGSVVNILTKSGTNAYHGSLYWTYNGNALNARSNLDKRTFTKAPWRVENQFAGTFGGPIIKDRTFFFGSILRWTDHRFASGTPIGAAPTSEGLNILKNSVGGLPQIKAFLDNMPAAQSATGAVARYTYGGSSYVVPLGTLSGAASNVAEYWQWSGRVDHRFNDRHTLMGRYLFDDRVSVSGQAVPPGLTASTPARRQGLATTYNWTLSSTMYNELRANFQRIKSSTNAADARAISIPSIEIPEFGMTGFNDSSSRTALGLAVNLPQSQALTNYQLSDNFGWLMGSHSLKFGVDIRRQDQNQDFNPTIRGRLSYNTLQDFVDDVAQTASINTFLPGVGRWQSYRYYDYAFYLQDEWRINPRFTITYGIRYETPGNPADFLVGVNQKVLANNNNDPRYAFTPVPARDMNNWAPRFGFNYKINDKTVLRGGYSRTYDLIFNNIYLNIYSAFPFTQVNNLAARTPKSYQYVYGLGFQGATPPAVDPMQVPRTIVGGDFRSPYAEQVSFQVQREVAKNWMVTAGYVGTKGTALFQTIDGNPTIPGTAGARRVDGIQGVRRLRANAASSSYNSLQTSLEKRLSQNFSMGAHYTWSTFIDLASEVFNPSNAGEVAVSQDSYNRNSDRGRSTYDRPQRFSINGVYELPFMREQKGVLGRIVGGWQVSGFLTFQAGAPFSALNGADPGFRLSGIDALVGNAIRPNVNTTLDLSSMSVREILNNGGRTLFSPVTAANPIGNAGRNILRAKGIQNLDLSITKNFKISESNNLQYRCEFYNSTNTRNYGIPEARINSSAFGLEGNTDGGNRRIVMALRYTF